MNNDNKPEGSITNCFRNCMGTVCFDGKFAGMRKPQEFIVYPMQDSGTKITAQSGTRIGTIDLFDGLVAMSKPRPSGAYFIHLQLGARVYSMLSREDCMTLKGWVKSTGGLEVGTAGVISDNTGAIAL